MANTVGNRYASIGSRKSPIENWNIMGIYFLYLLLDEMDPFGLIDLLDDLLFFDTLGMEF